MTKANVRGIDFGTGAEQVNSRTIPANFTPTNYTPSQVAAEGTDKLSAHLKGIDDAIVAGGPLAVVQAGGDTVPLTGLSASTSNDNVISGLPNGHGIEVGDRISVTTTVDVTFINYRTYGNQVIEIQNDLFSYVQVTDVVPAGLNGTYDLEVDVDGGGLTAVSFLISPGDTWADVVSAVSSGLTTASLAATAFFNSPSTLWAGGVSNANPGILIRSNTLGTGSSIGINNGSVNDFIAALAAESYSSNIYSSNNNGENADIALSPGFTFAAGTYSVSGPIYNGTFGIAFAPFVGVGILSAPLSPDLFTTGYTTQNTGDLSNDTAAHSMPGGSLTGTVSISNANDITYVGVPVTIASITSLDRIRKHYIENGNIGIGTDEPQQPLDIQVDTYYKGNPLLKNNHTASGPPTSSDDGTQEYSIGSTWGYNGAFYICTDATAANAIWQQIGTGTITEVNGDTGPVVSLSTSNVGEGANLYYTDSRVQTFITNDVRLPRWVRYTVPYTDLSVINNAAFEIFFESPGPTRRYIQDVVIHHTESFSGGGVTTATAQVYFNGVPQATPFDIFQSPSNTTKSVYQINNLGNFDTNSVLSGIFVVNTNLNELTQGSVDFWFLMSALV